MKMGKKKAYQIISTQLSFICLYLFYGLSTDSPLLWGKHREENIVLAPLQAVT